MSNLHLFYLSRSRPLRATLGNAWIYWVATHGERLLSTSLTQVVFEAASHAGVAAVRLLATRAVQLRPLLSRLLDPGRTGAVA